MPDNQNSNINEIIEDILKTERDVLVCLNRFVCKTLKEIKNDKSLSTKCKVKLSEDLIKSASKKEESVAEVIEEVQDLYLFNYDIEVDPERTIDYVEFDYCKYKHGKSERKKFVIWLLVDGEPTEKKYIPDCPCRWYLNKKVTDLKLIHRKKLKPDCMEIDVVYEEEPEIWIKLAPGASYPLPTTPAEVSKITFEAKTDIGTISIIELFQMGLPIKHATVSQTPTTIIFIFSSAPVESLSLTNTGSNPIYIRNLTTE